MKLKLSVIVVAAILAITSTAALAREYFDGEKPVHKSAKAESKKSMKSCPWKYQYPKDPKEIKRERAIFYFIPAISKPQQDAQPDHNFTSGKAAKVSNYPCGGCVLGANGKYEIK